MLGVERDTCSETRRITINPAPYFIVFSLFPLSISAIYCVPTNKLTISQAEVGPGALLALPLYDFKKLKSWFRF